MSIKSTQERTLGHKGSSSCKCKMIKSETKVFKHQNAKLDDKKWQRWSELLVCRLQGRVGVYYSKVSNTCVRTGRKRERFTRTF